MFIALLVFVVFLGSIYGKVFGRLFCPVDVAMDGLIFVLVCCFYYLRIGCEILRWMKKLFAVL